MSQNNSTPRLLIAGGGTGGHVFAGIAVAQALGLNGQVQFVGALGGLEERLVPRAGFPLQLLKLGALKGQSIGKMVRTLLLLPVALIRAAVILLKFRPSHVLGVGGYASGPMVLIARLIGWIWGVQTAILEQNAVPGITNRILGRVVHRVYSAFPGVEAQFPGQTVVVTGNPVRENIVRMSSASRDPFVIFVFGGSQGAAGINSLVLEALPLLNDLKGKIKWIHQTGVRDFDRVAQGHRNQGWNDSRVEKFIDDMMGCYQQASLLVCRAGSSTLAELAAVGRASVLVPFPYASDNHQEKNARIFSDVGAAELLIQGRATGADLAGLIRDSLRDLQKISKMESLVGEFHHEKAALKVLQELLKTRF